MLNQTAFDLLRNVLRESWGLSLQYFADTDDDFTRVDLGLRTQLEHSEQLYNQMRALIKRLKFGEITVVRDPFYLDVVLLRAAPDSEGFYVIGPFSYQPITDERLAALGPENGLTINEVRALNYLFRRIPDNISRSAVLPVAQNILRSAYGITDPPVIEKDHSHDYAEPVIPLEDINDRARRIEEVYAHEQALLEAITSGDEERAAAENHFFTMTGIDRRLQDRLLARRTLAFSTNTLFRKAAQGVGVHPLLCDEISERFAKKLELCTTTRQIDTMFDEMDRAYCRLCRDQATQGYGANVRKVIQYIQLNLSQDLSPEAIARAVNFSAGYISRRFKEEVGVSLGAYVMARRVDVACQMLERTGMTVREIANYVGIPDWNYFTKVFRKEKGCTPSQYRKQLREA